MNTYNATLDQTRERVDLAADLITQRVPGFSALILSAWTGAGPSVDPAPHARTRRIEGMISTYGASTATAIALGATTLDALQSDSGRTAAVSSALIEYPREVRHNATKAWVLRALRKAMVESGRLENFEQDQADSPDVIQASDLVVVDQAVAVATSRLHGLLSRQSRSAGASVNFR